MSTRNWPERIRDIIDTIAEIQTFCEGMSYTEFAADAKTCKAVAADLAIMGEAARHVPDPIVDSHPEIPWALMRGMRNRIVHAYFAVEPVILWDTVQHDLPPLVEPLTALLGADES